VIWSFPKLVASGRSLPGWKPCGGLLMCQVVGDAKHFSRQGPEHGVDVRV
jgi:hypothetical protein